MCNCFVVLISSCSNKTTENTNQKKYVSSANHIEANFLNPNKLLKDIIANSIYYVMLGGKKESRFSDINRILIRNGKINIFDGKAVRKVLGFDMDGTLLRSIVLYQC